MEIKAAARESAKRVDALVEEAAETLIAAGCDEAVAYEVLEPLAGEVFGLAAELLTVVSQGSNAA